MKTVRRKNEGHDVTGNTATTTYKTGTKIYWNKLEQQKTTSTGTNRKKNPTAKTGTHKYRNIEKVNRYIEQEHL